MVAIATDLFGSLFDYFLVVSIPSQSDKFRISNSQRFKTRISSSTFYLFNSSRMFKWFEKSGGIVGEI